MRGGWGAMKTAPRRAGVLRLPGKEPDLVDGALRRLHLPDMRWRAPKPGRTPQLRQARFYSFTQRWLLAGDPCCILAAWKLLHPMGTVLMCQEACVLDCEPLYDTCGPASAKAEAQSERAQRALEQLRALL